MSKMADLDIVLTDYKLSDAQKNAVVELLDGEFVNAKPNTIKSLATKNIVEFVDGWQFTEKFIRESGIFGEQPANVDREAVANIQKAEDVKKLAASQGIVLTDEEAAQVAREDVDPWTLGPDTFDKDWAMWERELMGFEATIGWKNTHVWHGLTAQEIREDMNTALPIGRKARRERRRQVQKALSGL
jgi:hypothetical protein